MNAWNLQDMEIAQLKYHDEQSVDERGVTPGQVFA